VSQLFLSPRKKRFAGIGMVYLVLPTQRLKVLWPQGNEGLMLLATNAFDSAKGQVQFN